MGADRGVCGSVGEGGGGSVCVCVSFGVCVVQCVGMSG